MVPLRRIPATKPRRQRDREWLDRLRQEGMTAFGIPPGGPIPPPSLTQAVQEFNDGLFFECHETLEELWLRETYPLRLFYQGVLKVAVGLLHLQRGNPRGARTLLTAGVELLEPFLPQFMGLDIARLQKQAQGWLLHLAHPQERASAPPPPPQISASTQ